VVDEEAFFAPADNTANSNDDKNNDHAHSTFLDVICSLSGAKDNVNNSSPRISYY